MGAIYEEDVRALADDAHLDWDRLDGSRILITGATGLIGGLAARTLIARNEQKGAQTEVVLAVRDLRRARDLMGEAKHVTFRTWDAERDTFDDLTSCDYCLHCASNTDSARMVTHPVETIRTTVRGTEAILQLCARTGARMVFVSSMEVYGAGSERSLDERCGGALDTMSVRSSYPEAKQLAETLCASFASEYGVAVSVARLAQTIGPGISPQDRRLFCEVARRCRSGEDIELATDGSKRNMYCYTADAVRALLLLLTSGEPGVAYNVANEDTYCSVLQMAQMAANRFSRTTAVRTNTDPATASTYAVTGSIKLDTTRISRLGWEARYELPEMFERMMADWESER